MAHLVETMAFTGQTPWHGLGNQLTRNQPLEVWAQQAGMDWRIESSNVSYMTKNERGQNIIDRKSTRLNSSHMSESRMPSSA